jgi:hypothetical protein
VDVLVKHHHVGDYPKEVSENDVMEIVYGQRES